MALLKVIRDTKLREAADPNANIKRSLDEGDILSPTGQNSGEGDNKWVEVIFSPKHIADIKGWVLRKHCEEAGELPPEQFEEDGFILTSFQAARVFNDRAGVDPWFVSPDFVIARAVIDTGLGPAASKLPNSDGVGPLQVSSKEWKSFRDFANDDRITEGQRLNPISQIRAATYRMFADTKAISDIKPKSDVGHEKEPFAPDYLDLFHAYITDSPEAAVLIREAVLSDKSKKLADVLAGKVDADRAGKLFEGRTGFEGSAQPDTIGEFVAKTRSVLDTALATAFDKIKTHAPEELLVVKQGEAPWFDVAEKEAADGVDANEPQFKNRILDYFLATDHGRPNNIAPWCGAFAAHCLNTCGSPIAAASIPASAALAVSWRNWGTGLPLASTDIPTGAVIVLSPEDGNNHIGFFDKFLDDHNVQLLGGNQTHAARRTPFKRSRIAAIRWLDLEPTLTGEQNDATPSKTPISDKAFDLIIEFEVTSRKNYEARLQSPEWPGESSGVTIGIGYDVGQTKLSVFESDWKNVIDEATFSALRATVGIVGPPAKAQAAALKNIVRIPWEKALKVHTEKVIPRWVGVVKAKLENTDLLNDDCLGALVSLTYNRGGGGYDSAKPRFAQMVAIKRCMANKQFAKIPRLIRDMKVLWPGSAGLRDRREREAAFFEAGLGRMAGS